MCRFRLFFVWLLMWLRQPRVNFRQTPHMRLVPPLPGSTADPTLRPFEFRDGPRDSYQATVGFVGLHSPGSEVVLQRRGTAVTSV